jgi:hypothetical protein
MKKVAIAPVGADPSSVSIAEGGCEEALIPIREKVNIETPHVVSYKHSSTGSILVVHARCALGNLTSDILRNILS